MISKKCGETKKTEIFTMNSIRQVHWNKYVLVNPFNLCRICIRNPYTCWILNGLKKKLLLLVAVQSRKIHDSDLQNVMEVERIRNSEAI